MKTLLGKLARLALQRPRTLWAGALVLALLLIPGLFQIRISNDYAELLPEQSPALRSLNDLSEKLEGLGEFIVVLEGAPIELMAHFADRVIGEIEKDPLIRRARYRTNTEYFEQRKFLYIPYPDLQDLVGAMTRKIKEQHLKETPYYIDLGVESEADETLADIKKRFDVDDYFSYFTDSARKRLLLLVSPRAFPDDVEKATHLRALVTSMASKVGQESEFAKIKVAYGGPYAELLHDHDILSRDIPRGGTLTGLLVLLLLWLAYRSLKTMLILLAPLVLTIYWNFALAGYLLPSGLNSMSSFLGMILFGLGIDFSIHLFNRYSEERREGKSLEEAIEITVTDTGESAIYAAATSAAAFFLLMLAHFRGYTQFGVLAGVGVLTACLGILTLLPALIVVLERGAGETHSTLVEPRGETLYQKLADWPVRHAGKVMAASLVLLGLAVWQGRHLQVNFDVSKYRPTTPEIAHVEAISREILDITSAPAVYSVTGKEEVDDVILAINRAEQQRRLKSAKGHLETALRFFEKISAALAKTDPMKPPLPEAREAVASALGSIREALATGDFFEADRIIGNAIEELDAVRRNAGIAYLLSLLAPAKESLERSVVLQIRSVRDLLPEDEGKKRRLLARLDRTLQRERRLADKEEDKKEIDDLRVEINVPPVTESNLPPEVVDEFRYGRDGYLVYLFTDHSKGDSANFALLFSENFGKVQGNLRAYEAAGPLMIEAEILTHLLREGPRVMIWALGAVVLLVILLLRTFLHTFLSLATLAVGFTWAAGLAVVLRQDINVFNVVTLPAIIGLSIDYSIHVIHRYQGSGRDSLKRVLAHTGASVWMSALTTMAGFAGLLPSEHAGLRSLGLVANCGILCAVLAIAFFFPSLAALLARNGRTQEEPLGAGGEPEPAS